MPTSPSHAPASRPGPRAARAALVALLALLPVAALGGGNSAKYRFEGNKWRALDLSVEDVRVEVIRFEWPATTMGIKTGYKATAKVTNGSSRQVRIGLAVALYDQDGKLVGAGTAGTTIGTIDPGDSAQFSLDFNHVTQRLEQASQFQIALETR